MGFLPVVAIAEDAPVEMPEVNVPSTRPTAFGTRGVVSADGSTRLFVFVARGVARDGTYLYGDFRTGDEIVKVDGRDISSFKPGEVSAFLRAGAIVAVRRRVALQKYELVEVECRRAEPEKKRPSKTPESTPAGGAAHV